MEKKNVGVWCSRVQGPRSRAPWVHGARGKWKRKKNLWGGEGLGNPEPMHLGVSLGLGTKWILAKGGGWYC